MVASTHECPAPSCEERVPFERLACRSHWFAVPPLLRTRLLHEYRDNFGETSYFEARAACLRALGVHEEEVAALNGGVA